MSGCVFCEIVAGRSPARLVYSDPDVIGLLDIHPVRPGHTLVIPRRHVTDLSGLTDELGGKVFAAARRVAAAMRTSRIAADGVNVLVNDGRAAFQTVFHHHVHVLPRHHGDKVTLARGLVIRRDPDADATAAALVAELGTPRL
ncbi:HIT family protein [Williamsia sterculiae]|uniref:Diadenosine tetraphosphate (Ap4A) hydrolase n=1 Tax=Williamsia sterculiae TaxID=1344003 RepID=A0A1N7GL08_9NOCA|nr:HIT family protein [Williamsia sterculiae]SIS13196.1 Diadenosine tetraphosphate (Ap4A) hydrolase [Williamsia sterculiae]